MGYSLSLFRRRPEHESQEQPKPQRTLRELEAALAQLRVAQDRLAIQRDELAAAQVRLERHSS